MDEELQKVFRTFAMHTMDNNVNSPCCMQTLIWRKKKTFAVNGIVNRFRWKTNGLVNCLTSNVSKLTAYHRKCSKGIAWTAFLQIKVKANWCWRCIAIQKLAHCSQLSAASPPWFRIKLVEERVSNSTICVQILDIVVTRITHSMTTTLTEITVMLAAVGATLIATLTTTDCVQTQRNVGRNFIQKHNFARKITD